MLVDDFLHLEKVSKTAPVPPHLTDFFAMFPPGHLIKKNPRNAPAYNSLSQVKEFGGCSSGFHSFLQLS